MNWLWAALALLALPSIASAAPPSGDYRLVFTDEFNGVAIDKSKWQVTYDGNPDRTYSTYNNAYMWPSTNAKVGNGVLSLIVSKHGNGYRTAALTTWQRFTYGYWEARLLPPQGLSAGIGANFWTNSLGWTYPENDIWEWSGSNPHQYMSNWHDGVRWASTGTLCMSEFTGWLTVGMEWTPDSITWSLNGVPRASTSTVGREPQPQWTLLGATVGPWGDRVDVGTVLPAVFKVDYLRVYQR